MSDLGVGDKLMCKWYGDGHFHRAEIVDTRPIVSDRPQRKPQLEYYIHYTEFDRRLDEWVSSEAFGPTISDSESSKDKDCRRQHKLAPDGDADKHRQNGGRGDDANGSSSGGLGHGELHPVVRNINIVKLGPHEINTW